MLFFIFLTILAFREAEIFRFFVATGLKHPVHLVLYYYYLNVIQIVSKERFILLSLFCSKQAVLMISTHLWPTDGRMDTPSYRDARTHLKIGLLPFFMVKNLLTKRSLIHLRFFSKNHFCYNHGYNMKMANIGFDD